MKLFGHPHRVSPVGRFADDRKAFLNKNMLDPVAHDGVVIREQNPMAHAYSPEPGQSSPRRAAALLKKGTDAGAPAPSGDQKYKKKCRFTTHTAQNRVRGLPALYRDS
jgi:hypothetical protein